MLNILFKQEKSVFFGKYVLTVILHYAMIVVLGRLGDRPFLLYDTDPEVVLCAAGFMFPRTAKSPCSVKS